MDFKGKTIWITGASSGIGRALAIGLSQYRCELILSGRNIEELNRVSELCSENSSKCFVYPFDLSNPDEVEKAAIEVTSKHPQIDALYNFGGVSQRAFALNTSLEIDRKIFEINYFSTITLTKAVLPQMIRNNSGQIAAVSSVVGKFGISYRTAYSASKHALHGFFDSLRSENSKDGIRITIIVPGRINTNISRNAMSGSGKKYGKMDEGQAGGMSAEKAASIIINALKKEKKEILFGGKETLMVYIKRFIPALYYFLATRVKPL